MKLAYLNVSSSIVVGLLLVPLFLLPVMPCHLKAAASEAFPKIFETVYVTKAGKKYHRAGCRSLKKKGIPIDLNQVRQSKTPCRVCNPLP